MTLWVVKGGQDGELDREAYNLANSASTLGWAQLADLSTMASRRAVVAAIRSEHPDETDAQVQNWASSVFSFGNRILPGDLIAMPRKATGTIQFGQVAGDYRYEPAMLDHNREIGPHLLSVRWAADIVGSDLDTDLLRSLRGGRQTVFQPRAIDAEARIRKLLASRQT